MKIHAGPSGREVISLRKEDSLLVLSTVREAKKVSAMLGQRDSDKNSFESKNRTLVVLLKALQ